MGCCLAWTGSLVSLGSKRGPCLTRDSMEYMTRWPGATAERTTRELGVQFRAVADTYRDTLTWLYQAGHLSAAQVGNLAQPEVRM